MGTQDKQQQKDINQSDFLTQKEWSDYWKLHGMEDVYFQKETNVNFWTVMGGLAAGALLTQLGPLISEVQSGKWYLIMFFISSILTIISSWVQSAWGSMILKWKLTVPGTIIFFFGVFSLSIQCLMVTEPGFWMASTMCVVFFSILMQYYFEYSGSWDIFTPASRRRIKNNIKVYYLFLVISLIGTLSIYLVKSFFVELLFAVVSLVSVSASLIVQHMGMNLEKAELGIP